MSVSRADLAAAILALGGWLANSWTANDDLDVTKRVFKMVGVLTELHDGKTSSITLEDS